jgi:hypothetical protein
MQRWMLNFRTMEKEMSPDDFKFNAVCSTAVKLPSVPFPPLALSIGFFIL